MNAGRIIAIHLSRAELERLPSNRYLRKLAIYSHLSEAGIPAGVGERVVEYGYADATPNADGSIDIVWREKEED